MSLQAAPLDSTNARYVVVPILGSTVRDPSGGVANGPCIRRNAPPGAIAAMANEANSAVAAESVTQHTIAQDAAVVMDAVTKRFGADTALDQLSLTVP